MYVLTSNAFKISALLDLSESGGRGQLNIWKNRYKNNKFEMFKTIISFWRESREKAK